MSTAADDVVNKWFEQSEITIGERADTPAKILTAKRLLYTWRDCFAATMREVLPTDMIYHSIDLVPGSQPVYSSIKKYNQKEREFAASIFPEMEEAGIIVRAASDWGARTQFPPKKKGSDKLRVVHNFIPLNKCTIKPQYPMHRMEEVLETIIKPKFSVFFSTDASNGYWAVPIKPGDEYKAGIVTPHGQYVYFRMGQGLKGALHTYSQFSDLVFGPLPKSPSKQAQGSIINDHGSAAFSLFMDDHLSAAISFESQLHFLYEVYFPRARFGPVYLSGAKTFVFMDSLEMVGFTGSAEGLRPSVKHRSKILEWEEPKTREDLEAFLWLTPFLRIFIPGRAEHVMTLKESYLEKVPVTEGSARYKYVEKATFDWGSEQSKSFQYIKQNISDNAMSGADSNLQYHVAADASKRALGACLFQLHGQSPGTEATDKLKSSVRIVMFMSFRLADAETRYHTTEREALAVVRSLAEVRWLIMGSQWPTKIYTDHEALESVMRKGTDVHGRIARWMDRLTEYDYEIHHRPCKANIMGIADGLSRMPGHWSTNARAEDSERMAMTAAFACPAQVQYSIPDLHTEWLNSKAYGKVVTFIKQGSQGLRTIGCGESEIKAVRRLSLRYRLIDQQLIYLEAGGLTAKCLFPHQTKAILKWAHDEHGHFANAITLQKLIGQWYWPTRASDVERYCRSCHTCQLDGPRKKSTNLKPIQQFYPFAMVGMDFLGPISPACEVTGSVYVLVVIDYFSRFVWIHGYSKADQEAVHDMWINHIAPVFGFPESTFCDNGSHFTGSEITALFESHGTTQYFAPISHPSSVGLIERNVQLTSSQIRKWVMDRGPQAKKYWGRSLPEVALNINTRLLRMHGFTPSQILMGYTPEWNVRYRNTEQAPNLSGHTGPEDLTAYFEGREEERQRVIGTIGASNSKLERQLRALWTPPRQGDLVMVRDFERDKAHGRKLDARWKAPRLLVEISTSGVAAYVQDIYGTGNTKKYHLDDLKVYYPRDPQEELERAEQVERKALMYAGFLGQRAMDLNSPPYLFNM